ncbi:hypothetical protein B9Z65_477 [Elsinoe australis]|uniref:Zn(2)-C6 fungal-type domain-containing protein n=1 Tax=Elsinoe australis TaxID=40998 RepID=A0A2P8AIR2_9PEZI|nr:hypothetical protein B9Z65_477 [Elsinoe australis]
MPSSGSFSREEEDIAAPPQGDGAGPSKSSPSKDRRKSKQQPRQLLSCSKCRERKVRCDRTKPCSACCARGHPKDCHFKLGEGTTFGPIQQSLELRKLRAENQQLKERLLEAKSGGGTESDDGQQSAGQSASGTRTTQRRFGLEEPGDSIYFGNPALANVAQDLANAAASKKTQSLAHPTPGAHDIFVVDNPTVYPYPTIWTTENWVEGLRNCLQPWEDISSLIESYIQREDSIVSPKLAMGISTTEVERFIGDFEHNAPAYPDLLALIFAILSTEIQRKKYDGRNLVVTEADNRANEMKGNLFVSASMQALRQSSFASQPSLLNVQAMVLMGQFLANSGRSLDAWMSFGTTMRQAQAIGLHRNPKFVEPLPSLRESALRKKLWWHLLFIDQQMSMTLGRPLGISAIGDCPFSEPLTTDAAALRVIECVDQLTILGRQIMGTAPLIIHRINNYTEKLQTLLDTLPDEVQFQREWISDASLLPDSPLDECSAVIYSNVHSYLILLNRQRLEGGAGSARGSFSASSTSTSQSSDATFSRSNDLVQSKAWANILDSCKVVLDVFQYLHIHQQSALIDWAIKHQALTAAHILLTDIQSRQILAQQEYVESAVAIFRDLAESKHDEMSKTAVSRLSERFQQIKAAEQQRRSSIATIPFPDYYSDGQDIRRDSQLSTSAAQQYTGSGYQLDDLKSPKSPDTVMGNTNVFQPQVMAAYLQHTLPEQTTPAQARRASLAYGSTYPNISADMTPRAATGVAPAGAIYSSPIAPQTASYRHSMHMGASIQPQIPASNPMTPAHLYQAMLPAQTNPQMQLQMQMEAQQMTQQLAQQTHAHPMQAQSMPQPLQPHFPHQPIHTHQQPIQYPPQQFAPGFYQGPPQQRSQAHSFSSQQPQHRWHQ